MNRFIKLFKNNFLKSVILIAGGTAFAQVINALSSPIITRIFQPAEYGVLTSYLTILGIFSLNGFKYEVGIPIAKDDTEAINVLSLSIIVLFMYVTFITLLITLIGDSILAVFNMSVLSDGLKYFLPTGIFLFGIYQILRQWAFRKKAFNSIAKTSVNQSLLGNFITIFLGFVGLGPLALLIGRVVQESTGIVTLIKETLLNQRKLFKKVSITKINWCLKRYKDFPVYNLPTHFLNGFSIRVPIIFISILHGVKVVGLFGLANTVVRLPMRLIGSSVGDVFYSEAASIGRVDPIKLKKLSKDLLIKLSVIGFIPLLTLFLFGPQLFGFVFGDSWYQAGVFSQIISVMMFFTLIFAPISRVYEVYERQKLKFYIDLFKTIFVLIGFWISWYFSLNAYITIFLYTLIMSSNQLIIFIFAQRILNQEINRLENSNKKGE